MSHNKTKQEFLEMVKRYTEGKATAEEIRFLNLYYEGFENQPEYLETKSEDERTAIGEDIRVKIDAETFFKQPKGKILSIYKGWWKIAAAACIILFIAIRINFNKTDQPKEVANNITSPADLDEIVPGGNKAILVLADGSRIILDSVANGNLASQGNTKVIKLDGKLSYTSSKEESQHKILYNTISTPRGGEYQIVLSDGSKVWLNAASSLRFPASFTGSERMVSLTGEAYFEITKNKSMPFKVDVAGKGEIEVLGTHFNVMSYSNEDLISATLLEGRIRMGSKSTNAMVDLAPGQQAQLNESGTFFIDRSPNIAAVMAWKNEKFEFHNTELKSIMRQLERWYDINVSYNNVVSDEKYTGIISRKVSISEILRFLESTGGCKFRIQGKEVIVN